MKAIFAQIRRFENIELQEGEQFMFTLPKIHIQPAQKIALPASDNVSVDNLFTDDTKMAVNGEYKITVKAWMTEPSTPQFDFHDKWNNGNPMPLRIMTGKVIKETPRMFQMNLEGKCEPSSYCSVCGRPLSNTVSKLYGIGPECSAKCGIIRIESEEEAREKWNELVEQIGNIKWTGWITKSAIKEWEEVK